MPLRPWGKWRLLAGKGCCKVVFCCTDVTAGRVACWQGCTFVLNTVVLMSLLDVLLVDRPILLQKCTALSLVNEPSLQTTKEAEIIHHWLTTPTLTPSTLHFSFHYDWGQAFPLRHESSHLQSSYSQRNQCRFSVGTRSYRAFTSSAIVVSRWPRQRRQRRWQRLRQWLPLRQQRPQDHRLQRRCWVVVRLSVGFLAEKKMTEAGIDSHQWSKLTGLAGIAYREHWSLPYSALDLARDRAP